jgi:methylated-DNA-protein-cysteine methyltransferase-like protein
MRENKFDEAVYGIVCAVPRGKVVSYGQVAVYVGLPRAARQVGWALRRCSNKQVPWWRVINNSGRISIKGNFHADADLQRELLRKDGVEVGEDFSIDIAKYRFEGTEEQLKKLGLKGEYLQEVLRRYGGGI